MRIVTLTLVRKRASRIGEQTLAKDTVVTIEMKKRARGGHVMWKRVLITGGISRTAEWLPRDVARSR